MGSIRDHASRLLNILHPFELFLVIAGVVLSAAKNAVNINAFRKLVHLIKLVLAFVALCEGELNVLSEVKTDHTAILTVECPPLAVHPLKK